jgi:TPR repeat protein
LSVNGEVGGFYHSDPGFQTGHVELTCPDLPVGTVKYLANVGGPIPKSANRSKMAKMLARQRLRHRTPWASARLAFSLSASSIIVGALTQATHVLGAATWVGIGLILLGAVVGLLSALAAFRQAAADRRAAHRQVIRFGPPYPKLGAIRDLTPLGVTPSTLAERFRGGLPRPPYLPRSQDSEVEAALQTAPLVIVTGESKAGKSRTAFEIAAHTFPDSEIIVPADTRALRELLTSTELELTTDPAILWLDELGIYLQTGIVSLRRLQLFLEASAQRIVVVGTVRTDELARLLEARDEVRPNATDLLNSATVISLVTTWGSWDHDEADKKYPGLDFRQLGIGATLTAKDEVVRRYLSEPPTSLRTGVVRAVSDWRRVGLTAPMPVELLSQVVSLYCPGAAWTQQQLADALQWANEPTSASVRLVSRIGDADAAGLRAADAVIEHDEKTDRGIPPEYWEVVLPAIDDEAALALAMTASTRGETSIIENALNRALGTSDPLVLGLAEHELGVAFKRSGRNKEAAYWWERSAGRGFGASAYALGKLARESDDLESAQRWWQKGAEDGDPRCLHMLSVVFSDDSQKSLVEQAWRTEAETSRDPHAAAHLGYIYWERGDLDDAEPWLALSAKGRDPWGMYLFGRLLVEHKGDSQQGLIWIGLAAAGDMRYAKEWLARRLADAEQDNPPLAPGHDAEESKDS